MTVFLADTVIVSGIKSDSEVELQGFCMNLIETMNCEADLSQSDETFN